MGTGGRGQASVRRAGESGFLGVLDLLKVAKHGRGENIYLIRFHYVRPRAKRMGQRKLIHNPCGQVKRAHLALENVPSAPGFP
jgi:hypothetical protein